MNQVNEQRQYDDTNTNINIRKTDNQSRLLDENYRSNTEAKNTSIVNKKDLVNRQETKNVVDEQHSSVSNINNKNIINEVNVIEERNVKNIKRIINHHDEEEDANG